MKNWPFPIVNDERTPESVALEIAPVPKPLTQYELCQSTEPEDALL